MADLQSLKNILQGCCEFNYDIVANYDFTQDDSCDESDSGGAWDLAGVVADNVLADIYECEQIDDLLYQRGCRRSGNFHGRIFCKTRKTA